jgi:hypothetical protein
VFLRLWITPRMMMMIIIIITIIHSSCNIGDAWRKVLTKCNSLALYMQSQQMDGSWEGEEIGHVNLQFFLQVCFIPGLNR